MSQFRILGISGSLRKGSWHTGLLRSAQSCAPKGISVDVATLHDIPLYNADVEAKGLPEAVKKFRKDIINADALLFASPEYNYSVSGVLKNAIDWASRPGADTTLASPFFDKPAAIFGAGGYTATVRSQVALRQIGVFLNLHFLAKPELQIRGFEAPKKFDENGNLVDEATRKQLHEIMASLMAHSYRLNPGKKA